MQMTSPEWCHEPRPYVDKADAAMTSAQSAARFSLEVMPGARLLMPLSTRPLRLYVTEGAAAGEGPLFESVGGETADDSGTTDDGGALVSFSPVGGAGVDA